MKLSDLKYIFRNLFNQKVFKRYKSPKNVRDVFLQPFTHLHLFQSTGTTVS